MKTRTLSLLAVTALAIVPAIAGRNVAPEIGKAAPIFSLTDTTGKAHSLKDFAGKTVVLEWFNKDCPFVKKHYGSGNMQSLQKWATGKKVVWLSIVSSAPGKQGHLTATEGEAVRKDAKISASAILIDEDGKVGRLYDAKTTPHMFIIDAKGTLVYNGGIDDKSTPNPADIATSRNHVKAALEEILAGKPVTIPTSQPYGCSVKY